MKPREMVLRRKDGSASTALEKIRPGQMFQVETGPGLEGGFKGEAVRDFFGALYFRNSHPVPSQLVHWSRVRTLYYLDPLATKSS